MCASRNPATGKAERPPHELALCGEHARECGLDRASRPIPDGEDVGQPAFAGEHGRAHHARGEARALFVHPGYHRDGSARPERMLRDRLRRFQRREHAVGAVVFAAAGLGVDVRADQQRRQLRLATLEGQEQVGGGIDRGLQADFPRPGDQRRPGSDLLRRQREPAHPAPARRAESGKVAQSPPKTIAVDALRDRGRHRRSLSVRRHPRGRCRDRSTSTAHRRRPRTSDCTAFGKTCRWSHASASAAALSGACMHRRARGCRIWAPVALYGPSASSVPYFAGTWPADRFLPSQAAWRDSSTEPINSKQGPLTPSA